MTWLRSQRLPSLRRVLGGWRALLIVCLVAGCEVGPDYKPPAPSMPAAWEAAPTTQASVTVPEPVPVERWWTGFHDATLDSLVRRAVESNLDLRAATDRVRQARASVGVARAGLFPAVNATGSYARTGTGAGPDQDLWQAGLDALWEADVFGGVRRSVQSAKASLEASVEDRRDVLVTLLGEVASDYILLRGYQQEIIIAQQNLEAQVRTASFTREKKRLGTGTDLDIAQADAQVAATKADLETLAAQEQQTVYALSVLLALPPAALDGELMPRGRIPDPPPVIAVGLPSELLRRRPDIRRAERQLAAATAQIGVATADLFPQFSLTGNLNLQASQFGGLGNWNNRNWSVGPNVTWAVFDAGAIRSNIEVQNALQAQALDAYHTTVLTALQEVQNNLVGYAREQRRRAALSDEVAFNERALTLATRRYRQGLTDFLSVLDAERSLYSSQDALVQSNRAVGIDAVALYKALGGGWELAEEPPATQPANR